MCGIVGVVVKANNGLIQKTENTFYDMLYADALRGFDSTGIIGVEKDSTWHIAKEASEAAWAAPQIKGGDIGKKLWQTGKAIIGHNRKKTQGSITDTNAHPFNVGNHFAMVHNGTLHGHKQLADTEVDSEALAIVLQKAFEKEDFKEDLEKQLGKVYGAYAVALYDQHKHTVYCLRNAERPLAYVEADDAFYFASEGMMLYWILSRNGYDLSKLELKTLPVHSLMAIDLNNNKMTFTNLEVKKATVAASTPITAATTTPMGNKTATTAGKPRCSKNQYKALRKQYMNKSVGFWIDDWVEKKLNGNYDKGDTELVLMGDIEEVFLKHELLTEIDGAKFNIKSGYDLVGTKWRGTVVAMEFDAKSGGVCFEIADSKPVLKSLEIIKKNNLAKELKLLNTAELWAAYNKGRLTMSKEDIQIYVEEINFRDEKMRDAKRDMKAKKEDVINHYRSKNIVLEEKIENGDTCCLYTPTGEKVHEDRIVIH